MLKVLSKMVNQFLGRGEYSITVPPMDGVFRPNELLESSENLMNTEAPDCLAVVNDIAVVSSRSKVVEVNENRRVVAEFDTDISCIAGLPNGGLVVGLIDGWIKIINGQYNSTEIKPDKGAACPTAIHADSNGSIFVTHGSSSRRPDQWKHDLLERNSSGSLWRIDLATGDQTRICDRLAFPYGVCIQGNTLIVAESWRSRILKIDANGSAPPQVIVRNLPGYPARLTPADDKGIWMSVFAPRSQLIEFVLRDPEYRKLMIREIDPDLWVAPTLRNGRTFLEPLHAGGVKQLGILKPWAPSTSYGLIVKLDKEFKPVASYHSRTDGARHGITSCMEHDGKMLMAVKGEGMVASLPLGQTEKEPVL